jgi:type 1 glutamine amidotransferase
MRSLGLALLATLPVLGLAGCGDTTTPVPPAGNGGTSTGGVGGSLAGAAGNGGSSGSSGASTGGTGAPTGGAAGAASGGAGAGTGGSSSGAGGDGMGAMGGSAGGAAGAMAGVGGLGGMSGNGGASAGSGSGGAGSGGKAGSAGTAGMAGAGGTGAMRPNRVLLYSFSTLNIPSVPAQLTILEDKLEGWNYTVDRSVDPAVFTDTNLARYAAVGMINTCFFPFGANNTTGEPQSTALQKFLQEGGGLFGTHCADVTFQSAAQPVLYNRLLGGRASSENFEGTSSCRKMGDHPTIAELPATFSYTGNLDNTNFIATDSTILVRCRWGNTAMTDVAVSWVRNEGLGRVFFSNFAKVDTDLTNATIGDDHLISGLAWVLGRTLPL